MKNEHSIKVKNSTTRRDNPQGLRPRSWFILLVLDFYGVNNGKTFYR